jgi:ribosomal protein L37AE/L43A
MTIEEPTNDAFSCPRCRRETVEDFYGPCNECRAELRAAYAGGEREVEVVAYEPKMNVVPNQIASKE